MRAPYATIAIVLLATAAYLAISGGSLYVTPLTKMYQFGVSRYNLLGSLTYSFMHIGFKHLLVNLTVLFAVGWIAESRIGWKHMLGLFFFTGITAGLAYGLLISNTWVIGSSAAIAGILVAAYLSDIKKTILVLTVSVMFASTIAIPLTDYALNMMTQSQEKVINETSGKIVELNTTIKQFEETIEEKKSKGENYTTELQIVQNLSTQLDQNITVKEKARKEKETIEEGTEKEATTPASNRIHLLGALAGIAYIYLFKREAFEWLIEDLQGIWNFLKRRKKNAPHKP